MIGTIEELEKEIDQFQKNVMASSELVALLGQMLDRIEDQNTSFEQKSDALISKVDNLPTAIEDANSVNNLAIKNDVSSELAKALKTFSDEQNRYITGLELTRKKIQDYLERSEAQERNFDEKVKDQMESFANRSEIIISKVDNLPTTIETANLECNQKIKKDISSELAQMLQEFRNEQNKYLSDLEQTRKQIQNYIDSSESQAKQFEKESRELLNKIDSSIVQIRDDNVRANDKFKTDLEKTLEKRNAEFAVEQQKYIDSIHQSEKTIKSAEERLGETYKEFIETLERMNISNLYEQNQQLRNELSKRTNILAVIAVLSIVIGIVGFFI